MRQQTWAGAGREVVAGGASGTRSSPASSRVCVAGSLTGIALVGSASGSPRMVSPRGPPWSRRPRSASRPSAIPASRSRSAGTAGQPLIVNFFASWCDPCKTETPLLAKFYRAEKGKVALVGLDENDVIGNATSFTRADGVSYPVGWDPQFSIASAYGVNALPQTFFLNARHQIVDRVFGAVTLTELHKGIALATAGG